MLLLALCKWLVEMGQYCDVSWYRDTFGMMHRYSCALYRPISNDWYGFKFNPLCFCRLLMEELSAANLVNHIPSLPMQ